MIVTVLGVCAAGLVILTGLPRLVSTIRARSIEGVSIWTFVMYTISGLVWIAYGILRHDAAIYVTNAFVVFNGTIISVMVVQRRRAAQRVRE